MNPFAALSEPIGVRPIGTVSHVNRLQHKREKRNVHRIGPWRLSKRQAQVLETVIDCGSLADAAVLLGVRANGLETTMWRVRQKMGANSSLAAAIAYDRWKRGAAQ